MGAGKLRIVLAVFELLDRRLDALCKLLVAGGQELAQSRQRGARPAPVVLQRPDRIQPDPAIAVLQQFRDRGGALLIVGIEAGQRAGASATDS